LDISQQRIAFLWPELPDYAARAIHEVIERNAFHDVQVIATRPKIPLDAVERALGQSAIWIDERDAKVSWRTLGLITPNIVFQSGYFLKPFNVLGAECKHFGGSVVLGSDQNFAGTLKQLYLEPIRQKHILRHSFDAIFVPGISGQRFYHHCGIKGVTMGLLGADPSLFKDGLPLAQRAKTLLFVGQFIRRKNVIGLIKEFISVSDAMPEWNLLVCGSGPLGGLIPEHPRIEVLGFVQPPKLAELLRQVRCLVLPSFDEHWGLVVHEAALSGCALALSRTVGAAEDLSTSKNTLLFDPGSSGAIAQALCKIAAWDDNQWNEAEQTSRRLSTRFGPSVFADAVEAQVSALLVRR
jgi:glycosyltransferase involved in cell wall biosynthesis